MNKSTLKKLALLFIGLKNRVAENMNFINEIEFFYKSGKKEFKGSYVVEENNLIFNFQGERKIIGVERVFDDVLSIGHHYEYLMLLIKERGTEFVLEADDKKVITKQREPQVTNTNLSTDREYLISPNRAQNLLKEIGIMSKDGKIKNEMIRKYNQIDHFVEVLIPILKKLEEKASITVLDCACGKSYLSFVLNYYIKEVMKKKCKFIGIDISDGVIESSKTIAKNLGYKNMEFFNEDICLYMTKEKIDIVISLHACDVATDYAIAMAVRINAESIVVVPCCHKELLEQIDNEKFSPILKHNIFKVRFNDLLTDSLRVLFLENHGYDVSALEYISPLDTPKNLMIRAIKDEKKIITNDYSEIKKMFNINPTIDDYIW